MKNVFKRTLSVLLVFVMVISCFTGTMAFAAADGNEGTVSGSSVTDSDVSDSDVSGSDVSDSDVSDSDVSDSDVSGSDVSGSDVSDSDVSDSDVSGSDVRRIDSVEIDSGDEDPAVVSCLGGSFKAVVKGERIYFLIALFQGENRIGSLVQIGSAEKDIQSVTIPSGTFTLPANDTDKKVEYTLYAYPVGTETKDITPANGEKLGVVSVSEKTDDIVVIPDTVAFAKEGGSIEVILKTNCTPGMSVKDTSWLKAAQVLNDKGGAVVKDGGVVIKVTASANEGLDRENYITFTKHGDTKILAQVKVTQEGVSGVERLAGDDRVATAVAISAEGWEKADIVILASGVNFADALAAAPLSAAVDAPVLLTMNKSSGLEKAVLDEIARLGAKKVYILGGTSAVNSSVESAVTDAGCAVARLAGDTRYGTAVKVAEELAKLTGKQFTKLYFANAWNFPDALSVSAVAAIEGNPILYMPTTGEIEEVTSKFVADNKCKTGVILGGTAAVSKEGQSSLTELGLTVSRISGEDRYETSAAIAKAYDSLFAGKQVALATGLNFPDALAGGALCAKIKAPVILAADKYSDDALAYIKGEVPESLIVFGGPAAFSDALAVSMAAGIKQPEAAK